MESNEPNIDKKEQNNSGKFMNEIFKVNLIKFKDSNVQICLQSENGPCPLIAILNVLLLKQKVKIPNDNDYISGDNMVHIVADYLMKVNENGQDIDVILQHFHHLQTGLIVDVCFSSVTDFKDDSNLYIFKFLNIKLYHGWLMDPQNTPEYDILRKYSYDQVTEELVKDGDCMLSHNTKTFLDDFIKSSQLTYHGLCQLNDTMMEGELAVLFQNNHFSVIYKNKDVYSLCTDIGYSGEPGMVWQLLNSTSGDTEFVNDNFEPQTTFNNSGSNVDTDWELAQKLAINDDYEIARALQEEDERLEVNSHPSTVSTGATAGISNRTSTSGHGPRATQYQYIPPKEQKKDSSCTLI